MIQSFWRGYIVRKYPTRYYPKKKQKTSNLQPLNNEYYTDIIDEWLMQPPVEVKTYKIPKTTKKVLEQVWNKEVADTPDWCSHSMTFWSP